MRVWAQCGLLAVLAGAMAAAGFGQSLAEAARQEQARKSAAPPHHVYTNEDFPSHPADAAAEASTAESEPTQAENKSASERATKKLTADELRSKILAQKQKVRALETRIAEIQKRLDERGSVGSVTVYERVLFSGSFGLGGVGPGYCAYVDTAPYLYTASSREWCEEPAKLTAEMDKKKAELEKERTLLEQMQEEARRLGYRSAVYDPD